MTESTRPLILGYIRAHLLMTTAEQAALEHRLASFAQREGYTLGMVYVEQSDTSPAAFDALLSAVKQQEATAVVVPTPQHVSPFGASLDMRDQLERAGAHVLVAGPAP